MCTHGSILFFKKCIKTSYNIILDASSIKVVKIIYKQYYIHNFFLQLTKILSCNWSNIIFILTYY